MAKTRKRKTRRKKSTVNAAGIYTKPTKPKRIFKRILAGSKGGRAGKWSARPQSPNVSESV